MSDLLASLKADLTSRRMLPLLVVAALALLGALGYGVLASKSSSSPSSAAPQSAHGEVASLPGPAVANAPANPNAAASETTVGVGYQHKGKMRNPFAPLPGSKSSAAASSSSGGSESSSGSGSSNGSSSSGGSGSTSSGSSGSPSSGGSPSHSEGSGNPKESGSGSASPQSAISLYHIDLAMQRLSETGTPIGEPQTFHDIIHLQPLPSKHRALLEPAGVTDGGTGVAFLLLRGPILHGKASCLPNAGDCEAIDVKLHQAEELLYTEEEGSALDYRLTVTKIEKVSGADASTSSIRTSAAGRELIARMHLSLPMGAAFMSRLGAIVGSAHR
jgi:hypothetical protein